jgi:hypothetical protein
MSPAYHYEVKNIEPVGVDTDVQARIFTLAPGFPGTIMLTAPIIMSFCEERSQSRSEAPTIVGCLLLA